MVVTRKFSFLQRFTEIFVLDFQKRGRVGIQIIMNTKNPNSNAALIGFKLFIHEIFG